MEEENSVSGLYRPGMVAQGQSFDGTGRTVEVPDMEQCPTIQDMDDSQLVGVPVAVSVDSAIGNGEPPSAVAVEVKTKETMAENGGGKRKRGRPPRSQPKPPPLHSRRQAEEEEDVCFICFDGGSLVLCDRKGCPKAYHPACVKRDEAFFRSRAKWNCGWHICSVCQKAAYYMCYTCTYSLCKGCTKNADFLCVRGNKGFCTACMKTIMLIENNDEAKKEMVEVDFDDKSNWEYLFKIYWLYLKGKLSLTLDELSQAKKPWKDAGTVVRKKKSSYIPYGTVNGKGYMSVTCEKQPSDVPYGAIDGKEATLNISSGHLGITNFKKRKAMEQSEFLNDDSSKLGNPGSSNLTPLNRCTEWASKQLLEFVAHAKNGDISVLSQFDVQELLWDYIKRNDLRDPHHTSEIICDSRLKTLFGKPRVGHYEMLKLLEFHFLIKEDSSKDVFIRIGLVDDVAAQVETGWNNDSLLTEGKDKKRRTCKEDDDRMIQTNLDEYAALDVHNINLIYLRRSLIENLIEDDDKFHDKVVGSIVRIRISNCDQKQDIYRLVQVVGTNKVAVPYNIGGRTSDIMLEVLNLDKKESISIDAISNQEFREDECRQLDQSIRRGFVKRLTVGEVHDKAMQFQAVKINDWLEAEILRLNHLRDQANEKGHTKEFRELVEKLQLLKTPEERQRRLLEMQEIHADPTMDPNYDSKGDVKECNDERKEESALPKYSGFNRSGSMATSPQESGDASNGYVNKLWKNSISCDENINLSTSSSLNIEKGLTGVPLIRNEGKDARGSINMVKQGNLVDSVGLAMVNWHQEPVVTSGSFSGVAAATSPTPFSLGNTQSAINNKADKLWHYRDPNGQVQGPFSMVLLQKWNTTGLFPSDMRIWASTEQHDSLLLTDALNGCFHNATPTPESQKVGSEGGWSEDKSVTGQHGKQSDDGRHCNNARVLLNSDSEQAKSDALKLQSSDWTRPMVNDKEVQTGSCSKKGDVLDVNNVCFDQLNVLNPLPSSALSGGTLVHQGGGCEVERWKSGSNCENWNLHGTSVYHVSRGRSPENQSNSPDYSGQSSGQNWRSLPEHNGDMNITCLPSAARKGSKREWQFESAESKQPVASGISVHDRNIVECQTFENKLPICLDVPKQDSVNLELGLSGNKPSVASVVLVHDQVSPDVPSSIPKPSTGEQKGQATESNRSVPSKFPVQDSCGPSWSSASSLVVGGAQIPEIADEWGNYSSKPAKISSVEEWDSSGLVSVSSLKPLEAVNDHVTTPTSKNDHLTHASPSHNLADVSSWQAGVAEPIEFSTLAEESVSDLLAEVDAMECQNGLASPTSVMQCDDELLEGTKTDCFNSIEESSPTPDPGKSDALSSTADVQLSSQSAVTDEAYGTPPADVFDSSKRSGGQSSKSKQVVGGTKSINAPLSHSDIQPLAPSTISRVVVDSNLSATARSESKDTGYETMQEYSGYGRSSQGFTNPGGWENSRGAARGNANTNRGNLAGSSVRDNHKKSSGERFGSSRVAVDSGLSRGRSSSSWSRQSFGGGGGGGGYGGRPSPKGQRVCKFYENGYCKKGAMCNYRHS